jgi:O-antigen/teichoic acid export membrane protein
LAVAGASIISALGIQHSALLQRQMQFRQIAVVNVVAVIAGSCAVIYAAYRGAGVWSLVIRQYATETTAVVMAFAYCRWVPGRPRRRSGVRPMVRIGAHQTGFRMLNFGTRNFDNVLIGRFVSDAALGFYTQAYRLLLLPIQQINAPISSVVVPGLSRLQDQPERYARFYYRAIASIAFVSMPIVLFLLLEARPVIRVVLGPNWLPAVPIFRALGIAAFLGTFNVASGWVYASLGRTDRQLRWQMVDTPLTVLAFFIGLPWGAVGVALVFSISRLLARGPGLIYCFRDTPISLGRLSRVLARPSIAAVSAALVVLALQYSISTDWAPVPLLLMGIPAYSAAYLLAFLVTPGGRREISELLTSLRALLG